MYGVGILVPPPQTLRTFYGGQSRPVGTATPYGRDLRAAVGAPPGAVPPFRSTGGLLPVQRMVSMAAKDHIRQRLAMSGTSMPLGAMPAPGYVARARHANDVPDFNVQPVRARGVTVSAPTTRVDGFLTNDHLRTVPRRVARAAWWIGRR